MNESACQDFKLRIIGQIWKRRYRSKPEKSEQKSKTVIIITISTQLML